MKKIITSDSHLLSSILKNVTSLSGAAICLILCGFMIMRPAHSYATFASYNVYAVNGANAPVGPATYCSGASVSYTCTDLETSCSNSYGTNTNTIQWKWYVDGGAISGATGSFTATGSGTTVTLSTLPVLAAGTHTLTCTFTPNQSNCGYYSYATITSPGLVITVGTTPSAITGTTTLCPGATTNLSDATAGGTWSSSSGTVATVSGAGVVYGVTAGSATISYNTGPCPATIAVTIGGPPPITGTTTTCPGSTTNLSDATAGGTWSSTTPGVATISAAGVVSGVALGTTTISYTVAGGCAAVTTVTIANLTPITGTPTLCPGGTTTLSDPTIGGTWSSATPSVATVAPTGIVHGVALGTDNITYTVAGCSAELTVTVDPLAAISGTPLACPGGTTTLSDAAPGGTWSTGNLTIATAGATTGVITGVAVGTTPVTYTDGGCTSTTTATVSLLPAITPAGATVCVGRTIVLSDAAAGGTWSSTGVTVATVGLSTGIVGGVSSGGTTISYSLGGCSVTEALTVGNAIPAITGTTTICVGSSATLADGTPGGTWSSATTPIATIVAISGNYTGVSAGEGLISYTSGTCSVTTTVTIQSPGAGTITGEDTVCISPGSPVTLSDAIAGGIWSTSSTAHATVTPGTGVVTGAVFGVDTVKYTITNTCGTYTAKFLIRVLSESECLARITPVTVAQLTTLKVYPNPNAGTFTMNLSSDIDEDVHVEITNIIGQKVRDFVMATNKAADITLNTASGIYLISATTSHGKYIVKVEVN